MGTRYIYTVNDKGKNVIIALKGEKEEPGNKGQTLTVSDKVTRIGERAFYEVSFDDTSQRKKVMDLGDEPCIFAHQQLALPNHICDIQY